MQSAWEHISGKRFFFLFCAQKRKALPARGKEEVDLKSSESSESDSDGGWSSASFSSDADGRWVKSHQSPLQVTLMEVSSKEGYLVNQTEDLQNDIDAFYPLLDTFGCVLDTFGYVLDMSKKNAITMKYQISKYSL